MKKISKIVFDLILHTTCDIFFLSFSLEAVKTLF